MKAADLSVAMPDVQGRADLRNLPIQHVGVRSLRYPVSIEIGGKPQATIGTWTLDVTVSANQKGAHMSRLIAWLDALDRPLSAGVLGQEIEALLDLLQAEAGRIEVSFPFFIRKSAPVTGLQSLMEYDGVWIAERSAGVTTLTMQARVPVKSLCPCSKEVSDDGAHNQRSHITLRVQPRQPLPWTELVRFAEDNASSELWGLLKRADEKWVTEHAYANPRFVEDLIRDVAVSLNADPRIGHYRVEVVNYESIHAHDAFAVIERSDSV